MNFAEIKQMIADQTSAIPEIKNAYVTRITSKTVVVKLVFVSGKEFNYPLPITESTGYAPSGILRSVN